MQKLKFILVLTFASLFNQSAFATDDFYAPGSFADSIFGEVLSKNELGLIGWVSTTLVFNDDGSDGILPNGALSSDEGFHLNQLALMFCKGDGCLPTTKFSPKHNLLSRITPTPAPKSESIDIGFNILAVYGTDSQFLRISGFDDFDFDDNHDEKLSIPQWYLDIYLPYFDGMNIMVGSFMSALSREIGYPYAPPRWFATSSYELLYSPIKHVGALVSIKLPTNKDFGLLSIEGGVTTGWNTFDNRNGSLAYLAGIRYRTSDMRTGIDLEMIYGNGADDFGEAPAKGGSQFFALSSSGKDLDRFTGNITLMHQFSPRLEAILEFFYGSQEGGDIKAAPQFIVEDAEWYGSFAAFRYQLQPDLHVNTRIEWVKDKVGANALFAGSPGEVYSFTTNLDWQINPYFNIIPEIKYDQYDGNGLPLFGNKTQDNQLLGLLNIVFKF
ncbi:MAG: hypothetical protein COB89_01550 [Piscirickettsiaceae bacterium]|nr:MAG: hypothetical protein COB89_01550 [Piscirickettsiaceae bacterium]